jgi:hypothetical protein
MFPLESGQVNLAIFSEEFFETLLPAPTKLLPALRGVVC